MYVGKVKGCCNVMKVELETRQDDYTFENVIHAYPKEGFYLISYMDGDQRKEFVVPAWQIYNIMVVDS